MRRKRSAISGLCAGLLLLTGASASAAPVKRVQVDQKGDFVLIGNTLAQDCSVGTPAPVLGTVGACGTGFADTAPDVFWRADAPTAGLAQADTSIAPAQARSTAVLTLPANATVTHAFLYWAASLPSGQNPPNPSKATLLGPGGGTGTSITALQTISKGGTDKVYQSVADITSLVQSAGPYQVSGVTVGDFRNTDFGAKFTFAGWWMVVFYQLPGDTPRNLALFDGLDPVSTGLPQNITLQGLNVKTAGFNGKLGVVAFDGDNTLTGDSIFFNGGAALSDVLNPATNFFNSTRSLLGVPGSVSGDLPRLVGSPQSMSHMDIDIVDITSKLKVGDTQASISASTTGDTYFLSGFVTSITTSTPDFSTSTKTATDENGGGLLVTDTLLYTITVTNSGNDDSVDTVVSDPLPLGVTYLPGTLKIDGAAKTDALGDDQAEYDDVTHKVTARLGAGASATQGGIITKGSTSTITFEVVVNSDAAGTTIQNQASITAAGKLGAPSGTDVTDGNGAGAGAPPTTVVVDECTDDTQCSPPTPHCDTTSSPKVCVECVDDTQCSGSKANCDLTTHTCVCIPTTDPSEICDNKDNDCDGTVDNGFNTGGVCSLGLGECKAEGTIECTSTTTAECNAVPGNVQPESCLDLKDNDCDGVINNGCTDTDGDGMPDELEDQIGTDKNDADSDDDGVPDGQELNPGEDTDGDGLINALDPDSDNDGLYDGTELGKGCDDPGTDKTLGHCIPDADPTTTTDPLNADTDGGGASDGSEDTNLNGKIDPGETDPTTGHGADDNQDVDSDSDGLSDKLEETLGSNPNDSDTDDDGVPDGLEANPADDTDGDGLINVLDPDSDNDGLFDGTETGRDCGGSGTDTTQGHCIADGDNGATQTSPLDPDSDHGGVIDGSEDANQNGVIDNGETDPTAGHGADDHDPPNLDSDGDGISDKVETSLGTDPNDADSDDDGVPDGQEPNFTDDTDGDGLINPLDPDSDNDGLRDGTELGLDCSSPDTDNSQKHCKADADQGQTKTSPLDPDTDNGGASDGSEDPNLDGKIDSGETDPTKGHGGDDNQDVDTDGDGLSDKLEDALGTDKNDADTDNDGVIDGQEPNPTIDMDGDGLIDALDPDSDNDGLFDGTELGLDCSNPATDISKKHCTPDADQGTTKTNPLDPDTDHGGASDGSEDWNLDGKIDAGETDPTTGHGGDDGQVVDTDGDGLGDKLEGTLGTNPMDADSDDDGVIDGLEPNPADDTDGDGKINALDPDSDGDGIFDGTELGKNCDNPQTDKSKNTCVADADGDTTTSPLDPDTDHGGLTDGTEDKNHNGKVDAGETDPNDPVDDKPSSSTTTTTSSSSGSGGGAGGAGSSSSSTTGGGGGGTPEPDGIVVEGNGILCSARPGSEPHGELGWLLGGALGALVALRRRRRQ